MTIKLENLSKWQLLPENKSIFLRSNVLRRIRLNVNTETSTAFMALEAGVEYFLGVVTGLETFVFSAEGDVEVYPAVAGSGVWFWTDDGDNHSHDLGDHKLFVKPMTREQRTPEMQALAEKVQARADRRFALQEENNQRLRAQLAHERADREAAQKLMDDGAGTGGEEQSGEGSGAPPDTGGSGEGATGA